MRNINSEGTRAKLEGEKERNREEERRAIATSSLSEVQIHRGKENEIKSQIIMKTERQERAGVPPVFPTVISGSFHGENRPSVGDWTRHAAVKVHIGPFQLL